MNSSEDQRSYLWDDGPGIFQPIVTWESYLAELRRLPDSVMNKQMLIEGAEATIAMKRRAERILAKYPSISRAELLMRFEQESLDPKDD